MTEVPVSDDDFCFDRGSLFTAKIRQMCIAITTACRAATPAIAVRWSLPCLFDNGVGIRISIFADLLGTRFRIVAHAFVDDLNLQVGTCAGVAAAAIPPFSFTGPAVAATASSSSPLHDVMDSALAVASAVGTTVYTPLGHLFPSVQRSCVVAATSC